MWSTELKRLRLEIINILSIDIELFFQEIERINQQKNKNSLSEEQKLIICNLLRGYGYKYIIQKYKSRSFTQQYITNQMRTPRVAIAELLSESNRTFHNWGTVINYLLEHGYKVNQERNNNLVSLGGRSLLNNLEYRESVIARTSGNQRFLLQNYDLALADFLSYSKHRGYYECHWALFQ